MFTACSSDIDYTEPDNITDEITFTVGNIGMPSKIASRAEHEHIDWNPGVHANTLGVFGFCEGSTIFDNQKVTYNSTGSRWEYSPTKYWKDYANKNSDFFGYMVEEADLPTTAKLKSQDGNSYILSFPASITSPILTSADNTPLICHAPKHRTTEKFAIPFEMDQTLTGYCLQFQLGEKMDNIRDFVITEVKIYGDNLPTGGTVSRTYTFADGTWTAAPVKWENVTKGNVPEPLSLESAPVTVTSQDWTNWGTQSFFAIPHADFNPTIEVTYDVVANDDNNGDNTTITRKDVKSTIILNKINFSNLATATTGEIHPIRIKIVPDYLYVLSDDDQSTGVLVVGK